jgi:hypothetical protein
MTTIDIDIEDQNVTAADIIQALASLGITATSAEPAGPQYRRDAITVRPNDPVLKRTPQDWVRAWAGMLDGMIGEVSAEQQNDFLTAVKFGLIPSAVMSDPINLYAYSLLYFLARIEAATTAMLAELDSHPDPFGLIQDVAWDRNSRYEQAHAEARRTVAAMQNLFSKIGQSDNGLDG